MHPVLSPLDYSLKQIARIAAHRDGVLALEAVRFYDRDLHRAGFLLRDIVEVAAVAGGPANLHALLSHYPVLLRIGFIRRQLVPLAGREGGDAVLGACVRYGMTLRRFGFTPAELWTIGIQLGSPEMFELMATRQPALQAHSVMPAEQTRMARQTSMNALRFEVWVRNVTSSARFPVNVHVPGAGAPTAPPGNDCRP
jgi:hypothetical protein